MRKKNYCSKKKRMKEMDLELLVSMKHLTIIWLVAYERALV